MAHHSTQQSLQDHGSTLGLREVKGAVITIDVKCPGRGRDEMHGSPESQMLCQKASSAFPEDVQSVIT